MFSQVIPFNTTKGGTTPDLCLSNVSMGYGIGNKYDSAWEAWQHTQQHTDRNVPSGLDVPVYYSYTTTIDGITKNYGHINVQLKNGTVWSDGNIYTSIDDYTSKKAPKFVGWGESVNDVKVIEGDDMSTIGAEEARILVKDIYGYTNENDIEAAIAGLVGLESNTAIRKVDASSAAAAYKQQISDGQTCLNTQDSSATVLKPGKYQVN